MGSPRVDVVFRLWQCDKENHGWREGPPLTVPCQSFDLLAGPSPSRQNQLRTKKEYSFAPLAARSSIRTLAGLKRQTVKVDLGTLARFPLLIRPDMAICLISGPLEFRIVERSFTVAEEFMLPAGTSPRTGHLGHVDGRISAVRHYAASWNRFRVMR